MADDAESITAASCLRARSCAAPSATACASRANMSVGLCRFLLPRSGPRASGAIHVRIRMYDIGRVSVSARILSLLLVSFAHHGLPCIMHEAYTRREQTLGFLAKRAICRRFDLYCNGFGAYLLQLRVGRLCVQQHGRVRVTRDQRRALTRQGAGSVECKAANYGVQECGLDVPESRAHA